MPGSWRIEVRYFPEGAEVDSKRSSFQATILDDDKLVETEVDEMMQEFMNLCRRVCEAVGLEISGRL